MYPKRVVSSTAIVKAILAAVRSFPPNLQCLHFSPLLLLVSCVLLLLVLFTFLVFSTLNSYFLCLPLPLFPLPLLRLLLKLLLQRRKLCSPHWVSSESVLNPWRRTADAACSTVQALHMSSGTVNDHMTNEPRTDNNELTTFHKTRKT